MPFCTRRTTSSKRCAERPLASAAVGGGVEASRMSASAERLSNERISPTFRWCASVMISLNGSSTMACRPSGAEKTQSGTSAEGSSGAWRPPFTTTRGAWLRWPVLRVPSVGHQRSSALASRSASPP
ncbi:hypothetical protein FQZ97_1054420 [compost metagenome]